VIRLLSLNLRGAMQQRLGDGVPQLLADQEPHVVLLQECRPEWVDPLRSETGMEVAAFSHDISPTLEFFPPDGTAILVRPPAKLNGRPWRLAPADFQPSRVRRKIPEPAIEGWDALPENLACRYALRTAFAELSVGPQRFVAASFHATPGRGWVRRNEVRVHEFKPFFHGAVAAALSEVQLPFIFAIDANEPRRETAAGATFHWAHGRPGSKKLEALLSPDPEARLHRARDLLRVAIERGDLVPESEQYLALTHTVTGGTGRRYDSIWATSEFSLQQLETLYQPARDAGTDHALLVADVEVTA
jgi:hypothetical protein